MTNVFPRGLGLPVFLLLSFRCHKARLINTFKSQLKNIFTDQLPPMISSDSFSRCCNNAFNGVDVQARWSCLYLVLPELRASSVTFPGTRSLVGKCQSAFTGRNSGIFRAKPAGWKTRLNRNSRSEMQTEGFKPKPINELFDFSHLQQIRTRMKSRVFYLFLVMTRSHYPDATALRFIGRSGTLSLKQE